MRRKKREASLSDAVAIGQGAFWIVSGIWPILHIRSFEAVTGPKVDKWLVKTVGGLITCIGGVLLLDGLKHRSGESTRMLGASSAAALTAIDIIYSTRGRISKIYLLDAVAESGIIAAWLASRPSK